MFTFILFLVPFHFVNHILLNQLFLCKLGFNSPICHVSIVQIVSIPRISIHQLKVSGILVIHVLKPLIFDQIRSQFILSDFSTCLFPFFLLGFSFSFENVSSLERWLSLDLIYSFNSFLMIFLLVILVLKHWW